MKRKETGEYFEIRKLQMETKKGKAKINVERISLVVRNAPEYLEDLRVFRDIPVPDCHKKIGIDKGQESLKMTGGVLNKKSNIASTQNSLFSKDLKYTGVKKIQILGIAENVSESHSNVEKLVKACNLSELDHKTMTYTGDQKMGYCMSGHQGQNSTKPCMYCLVIAPLTSKDEAELRTLGLNRQNCRDFHASTSKQKLGKNHNNIVHEPLFIGPDDKLILDCFPVPALHIKLRSVNHICDHLTIQSKKKFKDADGNSIDMVLEFCKDNHIVKKNYFGGQYEGNQCNAILKQVDKLEAKLPRSLKKFTKCLGKLSIKTRSKY